MDIIYGVLDAHVPVRSNGGGTNFTATFAQTLRELAYEAERAKAEWVEIQLAITADQITRKGELKAKVLPKHRGVAVILHGTPHGDLRYDTASFSDWRKNLRALVIALEAYRKLERYGLDRGKMRSGFKQLQESADTKRARALIAEHGEKGARMRAHPDAEGGSDELWIAVDYLLNA